MALLAYECSFESWVGQASKIAFAGYIVGKAGGPKEAYFDKPSQEQLHDMQQARFHSIVGLSADWPAPQLA